ncbi:hypothetical protein AB0436_28500 [Streptomyces sp. NPDC051322]|uniref:hypothetical protein n=1 Tax=Streptomyces sp. NPDC051322 TaxID=3154645 RepID=UPI00344C3A86
MTSQIITLIGVLLGALTSFVATNWAERARFRQTLATRWDERKLDAYIEYMSCVKEVVRAARQAMEAREHGDDNAESIAEMQAAEARRSVLFEGLILLCDDAAADAARAVNQRTWDLLRLARRAEADASGQHRELGRLVIEALNTLHVAARQDLAMQHPMPSPGRRQTPAP